MGTAEFAELMAEARRALDTIAKGDASVYKQLLSSSEDVTLANPFGGVAHGREAVVEKVDRAASNFRDGEVVSLETISQLVAGEVAYTFEIERFRSKVAGSDEFTEIALRTSCVYRLEDGEWKILHRHADPRVEPLAPESTFQS